MFSWTNIALNKSGDIEQEVSIGCGSNRIYNQIGQNSHDSWGDEHGKIGLVNEAKQRRTSYD